MTPRRHLAATLGLLGLACSPPSSSRPARVVAQTASEISPSHELAPSPTTATLGVASHSAPAEQSRELLVTSLRFSAGQLIRPKKTAWILDRPSRDGERLGYVGRRSVVRVRSERENGDCGEPWVEIEPRGWMCEHVSALGARAQQAWQKQRARRRENPRRKKSLPGVYGQVAKAGLLYPSVQDALEGRRARRAASDMVRRVELIEHVDGRQFWRTQRDEYVDAVDVTPLRGTRFRGVLLDQADEITRVAFALDRGRPQRSVAVRRAPSDEARHVGSLKPRTVVRVLEWSERQAFARIGPSRWIARADLRVPALHETPAEAQGRRWVDVDLDAQLVTAYEGDTPVFVTLTSTGRKDDPTPTGLFQITRKKPQTTMASDRDKDQTYSAAVPWAAYFFQGYALHSAYWHGAFGAPHSHGCVNLSPSDALTLYDFLDPQLPEGWGVVYAHPSQPGSLVRIHAENAPFPTRLGENSLSGGDDKTDELLDDGDAAGAVSAR